MKEAAAHDGTWGLEGVLSFDVCAPDTPGISARVDVQNGGVGRRWGEQRGKNSVIARNCGIAGRIAAGNRIQRVKGWSRPRARCPRGRVGARRFSDAAAQVETRIDSPREPDVLSKELSAKRNEPLANCVLKSNLW